MGGTGAVLQRGVKLCERQAEEEFSEDINWRQAAAVAGVVLVGGSDVVDDNNSGVDSGGTARTATSNGVPRVVNVQLVDDPESDYSGAAETLYATWWPLFPFCAVGW